MLEVVEYIDEKGRNAFAEWLKKLDRQAFSRMLTVVARMEEGNLGDTKSVGSGVSETRLHAGPGYRIYFGRDGNKLVILLGGGTKRTQDRDIKKAQTSWAEYQANKKRN